MESLPRLAQRTMTRVGAVALILTSLFGTAPPSAIAANPVSSPSKAASCQLSANGGAIQHVVEIQFDNTHFTRDNPNVPSDLEQMPNFLNFLEENGTLLTNHHTPLIAHTATDNLTTLTGVYGDRHGDPVSNSFRYFNPDGTSQPAGSFAYWTSLVHQFGSTPTDFTYNMLAANGKNAPAPWVPFTRAGCNFGAVAAANITLENTTPDVALLFGAGSPQDLEAQSNPDQATLDFVGVAVHCAAKSPTCSKKNGGVQDLLPNEPHGYSDYNALIGHKYIAPQIAPGGNLKDLSGNPITGFPGFGGISPAQALAYVAGMQENGVPVTYAYISDAHDNHVTDAAYGPGEAGYVAQLQAYDTSFGQFFKRLNDDGVNPSNTLFVITSDEGDHFVGGAPSPTGCNGVTVPCTYTQIGELDANSAGLLATQAGITTSFAVHSDSAPQFYLNGNPQRTDPMTRAFERALAGVTVSNPLTGVNEKLTYYLADPVEMGLLHLITADPQRTPTFNLFAKPDYCVFAGAANCTSPCVSEAPAFAWNHGDVAPDINTTWLGLVGPGMQKQGTNHDVWSDHTDVRPTILALVGLADDYSHQGRALVEVMTSNAIPAALRGNLDTNENLMKVYKQIDAPVAKLGLKTLEASTVALSSGSSSNDSTYTSIEGKIAQIAADRDTLATTIEGLVEGATFHGQPIDPARANRLISQANALLDRANALP